MDLTARVTDAMTEYYAGDVRRINHFMKVYAFARAIGQGEELDGETQRVVEIAALTHDIGIRNSEIKYHSATGEHQQVEGPPEAEKLLSALAVDPAVIRHVCWLIAHHHTYADIRGADYQILVEADFLVNIHEDGLDAAAVAGIERKIFRTAAGKTLLRRLYGPATESAEP